VKHLLADIFVPGGDSTRVAGIERHMLDEELFQHTICLERKRAERSRSSFLLVLLDLRTVLANDSSREILNTILSSLWKATRETDVAGWHKSNAVLGVLLTDVPTEGRTPIVGAMLARVSGVLYSTLTFDQFCQITISHYIFPEEWDCDIPQRPSDPELYPDLDKRAESSKMYLVTKRIMDIVGSALGLLIAAPFFLVIAVAIKLTSKGPVFFRQQRIGHFGKPFIFLKFRSMYLNNDPKIHLDYIRQLISGTADRQPSNGNGHGIYKLTTDPRVTRAGAFLRRTSLDELPQLINVLRGEMSLVGPRPPIPYEVDTYQTWHRRRVLEAKPGITGLWQVSGRSRVKFDEMVRLDVRYAMQRSLWLDLKILLLTPRAVILGEGAC